MIAIDILCVGKLKEKYLKDGIAEYAKRLSRFCSLSLTEVEEEPLASSSAADVEKVRQREGKRLLARADGFVVALCIEGKQLSSPQFSELVSDLPNRGVSRITFVIGGSYGLSDEVVARADLRLSFGKFTYPHQLMRLILCEQIYRAFMIAGGGVYHK